MLLWKNDDNMSQDTLFELQENMAKLLLEVAQTEGKTKNLIKSFPFLYQAK
jgi:hypothetical protein